MSTPPVTLMVSRRAAHGRYQDLLAWLHEGEQLATDFPGYLGSGILAPPRDGDEFQIIFRFSDEPTCMPGSIPPRAGLGCNAATACSNAPKKRASVASTTGLAPIRCKNHRAGSRRWPSGWRSSGVAGVQPAVWPLAGHAGPAAPGNAQHPGPDAGHGVPVHPPVHPPAGQLAACLTCHHWRPAQPLRQAIQLGNSSGMLGGNQRTDKLTAPK